MHRISETCLMIPNPCTDMFIPCHSELEPSQTYEGQVVYNSSTGQIGVVEKGTFVEENKGITLEDF